MRPQRKTICKKKKEYPIKSLSQCVSTHDRNVEIDKSETQVFRYDADKVTVQPVKLLKKKKFLDLILQILSPNIFLHIVRP